MTTMDEDMWDILLSRVEAGEVIPVVGDELLRVTTGDGNTRSLYGYLAERVSAELKLNGETPHRTLHDVFCQWRSCASGKRGPERPYATLNRVYSKDPELAGAQIPVALRDLAEITDFKLVVSTTFDDLLARALSAVRSSSTKVLSYSPVKCQDLSEDEDIDNLKQTTVFQLMGKLASVPDDYAVTEEDYLEFIYSLQSPDRRPVRLFEGLRSKRLLVLGSGLCDWLVRFLLRGKSSERFSKRSIGDYLVGARVDTELVTFLGHFAPNIEVISGDPTTFVSELRRRWAERRPRPSAPPPSTRSSKLPAPGSVFISYAREDRQAAQALHGALDQMGIEAWFDRDDLAGGEDFDESIRRAIQASVLFIPIISERVMTTQRRYFRKEWDWAVGELKKARRDLRYVIPIVVDDTSPDCSAIDAEFSKLHWLSAPSSKFTEELLLEVRSAYRAYQAHRKSMGRQ